VTKTEKLGPTWPNWYVFFLDADSLVWETLPTEEKRNNPHASPMPLMKGMNADCYEVKTVRGKTEYMTICFCWLGRRWEWSQVVHEYVDLVKGEYHRKDFKETLKRESNQKVSVAYPRGILDSRAEGGRSKDPLTYFRDARLLQKAVISDPNNSRAWMYLGNSYNDARSIGGTEFETRAWKIYMKRGTMTNGFDEERYLSYLNAAKIMKRLSDNGKKPNWDRRHEWNWDLWTIYGVLMKAIDIKPERFEAFVEAIELLDIHKHYAVGYYLGSSMLFKQKPTKSLLLDETAYQYRLTEMTALCAYYSGNRTDAYNIYKRLLNVNDIEPAQRERITTQMKACERYAPAHVIRSSGEEIASPKRKK
jgi:tetratricopeptide (TPR) repeat protein